MGAQENQIETGETCNSPKKPPRVFVVSAKINFFMFPPAQPNADLLRVSILGAEVDYRWLTEGHALGIHIYKMEVSPLSAEFTFAPSVPYMNENQLRAFANFVDALAERLTALDIPSVHTITGNVQTQLGLTSRQTPSTARKLNALVPSSNVPE